MRILAFPYYTDNPYLDMLYADAVARGATVIPATDVAGAVDAMAQVGPGDVIHLHWTTPICQPFADHASAKSAMHAFTRGVRRAKAKGARFIWTVHNVRPHEMPHARLEARLTRWILRHADDILVLSAGTHAAVSAHFQIPARKCTLIAHSSYLGLYPDVIDRDSARRRLGIIGDGPVVGFLGEQRGYKGIPDLIAAFRVLRNTHPEAILLLAGRVRDQDRADILRAVAEQPGIVFSGDRVPVDDVQVWLRAADVMAFPYLTTLNSGSMFLAATFGRPCVLPAVTSLRADFAGEAWLRFYEPTASPAAAISTAIEALIDDLPRASAAADRFARVHSPEHMSAQFSGLIGLPGSQTT